jgi:hypothetical protein
LSKIGRIVDLRGQFRRIGGVVYGRSPSVGRLWDEILVPSRLLEYEVWNRCHFRGIGVSRSGDIRLLLDQIDMYEPDEGYLGRALLPFPIPVRTLDALHLATADHLRQFEPDISLASYDQRLLDAAAALGIEAAAL